MEYNGNGELSGAVYAAYQVTTVESGESIVSTDGQGGEIAFVLPALPVIIKAAGDAAVIVTGVVIAASSKPKEKEGKQKDGTPKSNQAQNKQVRISK